MDLDVRFIHVPRATDTDTAASAPAKVLDEQRCELRLPVPDRLMAEFNATEEKHLREITQAELVAQVPSEFAPTRSWHLANPRCHAAVRTSSATWLPRRNQRRLVASIECRSRLE